MRARDPRRAARSGAGSGDGHVEGAARRTLRGQRGERGRAPCARRARSGLTEGPMELPILTKLKREIAELQRELSVELPKELAAAAAHGDLSENAEYEAAKNRQDYVRS